MTNITPLIERIEKRATEEGVLDLLALSQLKATLQGLERERVKYRTFIEELTKEQRFTGRDGDCPTPLALAAMKVLK